MSQEISREPSQQQPVPASEIRPRGTVAGKRLLALLAIGFIFLTLAVRPSFLKTAWPGVTRIVHVESTPPPALLVHNAKGQIQSPATPAMAPQSQSDPPTADAQGQKLWTDFEKSSWGAPLQDWSALHADVACAPFRGNMWGRGADAQWAQQCSIRTEPQAAAHWSLYIFTLQEPLVSRLEQFDETTIALPEEALASIHNALARLAARYGPAEDRSPTIARPRVVQWPEYLRWQSADLEIQLNLSEFDPQRNEGFRRG